MKNRKTYTNLTRKFVFSELPKYQTWCSLRYWLINQMKNRVIRNEYLGYLAWKLIEDARTESHELMIDQAVYDHMLYLNYIDDLVNDLETYVYEEMQDAE